MLKIDKYDDEYEMARRNWDPWTSLYPKYIVYVSNNKEIINCINFCHEKCLKIRIRSGGHSLGKDASSVNDGLVVDISLLNKIKFYEEYVSVEAGTKVGDLVKELAKKGMSFPFGDAATVGTGGIIPGGGIGLLNKHLGLCCDNILGLQMIDYKGEILDSDYDKDILWANQGGGGGNFGVITKFRIKYTESPNKIRLINIKWKNITSDSLVKLIFIWMNDIRGYDINICTSLQINSNKIGNFNVLIEGLNYGNKMFDIPDIGCPKIIISNLHYEAMVNKVLNPLDLSNENYRFASFWSGKILPKNIVESIIYYLSNNGSDCYFLDMGGKFNTKTDTSFYWRNAIFYFEISAIWKTSNINDDGFIFQEQLEITRRIISPHVLGSYVNVPNNNIEKYEKEYYGCNRYRLREIKRKLDPNNFFNFSQSINFNYITNDKYTRPRH